MKAFVIKPKDLTGYIKGFPIEIIRRMIEYQVEQGNEPNIEIFQNNPCSSKNQKGFDWDATKEGFNFWEDVIFYKDFDLYFKTYSKNNNIMQTPYYLVQTEVNYKYIKLALHEFGYNIDMMSEKFHSNHNAIVLNLDGEFGLCGDINIEYAKDHNRYLVKSLREFIINARKFKESKTNSNNNTSTNMKTPCIFVKNEKEYNYIRKYLIVFGYDINSMPKKYNSKENLIVLNFENTFGKAASLE